MLCQALCDYVWQKHFINTFYLLTSLLIYLDTLSYVLQLLVFMPFP